MEVESIVQFFESKTILVTGATGFLAKTFLEKLLRVQPKVKRIFLLIRAPNTSAALHRLDIEVVKKDLFNVIKDKYGANLSAFISEKVTAVAGDITCENFGVSDFDGWNEMLREVDVVVNSAATTKFDERYDVALGINTLGVKHVCSFISKCLNVKLLLHISTAYVSGEKPGIILETPYKMGETLNGEIRLDISNEKNMIEEKLKQLASMKATKEVILSTMTELGIQRAKLYGWSNTYAFTKAMGEMLLLEELQKDISLVIVRPTIITSTYKEPFPGWIEGLKTIDSFSSAYSRGRTSCFLADHDVVLDLIPADMVVDVMITAIVAHANKPCSRAIYHAGSSKSNPLKISCFKNYNVNYFSKYPITNKLGNPIKVTKEVTMLHSMSSFQRYITFHYMIPLKVLEFANMILCGAFSGMCMDANRKIKNTLQLAELFRPYVLVNSIFDDTNLNKLRYILEESVKSETQIFFFDPKFINWEDYFMNLHFPGLRKYVFKQ